MKIPEGTIETLKQVQQNGHKIFLCSGRARGNIRDKTLLDVGFEEDPYVIYLFEEMGKSAKLLKTYTPDIRINKFSADVLEDTDYARIKKELGDDFDFLEHEGNVVECVPKGTSKATGIAWLCKYLGVPREETYAIGDSVNDLDMLAYVGHGIAMGNATQSPKEFRNCLCKKITKRSNQWILKLNRFQRK